jgi:hypothetical protein
LGKKKKKQAWPQLSRTLGHDEEVKPKNPQCRRSWDRN